ncbi:MAG: type II secretion system protein M [Marinobacter sp.]|nr:type II secretion system protein M [Marinobacter sp.]
MWSFLSKQPVISKLIARYDELPARDRHALAALAFALLLAVLYFMVWRPAVDFHDRALSSRENASELLAWMEANESAIQALSAENTTAPGRVNRPVDGRALMSLVTRTAGEVDLPLQRFEPSGDDAVRVWLDSVTFADVAGWLEQLTTEHGIIIDQASMDRANDPGVVSVRLTLTI